VGVLLGVVDPEAPDQQHQDQHEGDGQPQDGHGPVSPHGHPVLGRLVLGAAALGPPGEEAVDGDGEDEGGHRGGQHGEQDDGPEHVGALGGEEGGHDVVGDVEADQHADGREDQPDHEDLAGRPREERLAAQDRLVEVLFEFVLKRHGYAPAHTTCRNPDMYPKLLIGPPKPATMVPQGNSQFHT
jgi:hypothetical protein